MTGRRKQFARFLREHRPHRRRVSNLVLGARIDDPRLFFGSPLDGTLPSTTEPTGTDRNNAGSRSHDDDDDDDDGNGNGNGNSNREGSAFDAIVVESSDGCGLHHAGETSWNFSVSFGGGIGGGDDNDDGGGHNRNHDHNHNHSDAVPMAVQVRKSDDAGEEAWFWVHPVSTESQRERHPNHGGTTKSDPWSDLRPLLEWGSNPVVFWCLGPNKQQQQQLLHHQRIRFAKASIWLWKATDAVVVSDIDGTITKSNTKGALGTLLTKRYEEVSHSGICHLLHQLVVEASSHSASSVTATAATTPTATRVVYLTSRSIGMANKTRDFLSCLSQPPPPPTAATTTTSSGATASTSSSEGCCGLPEGPLLGFGGGLAEVLAMELVSKTTQAFKAGQIERHVVGPLRAARRRRHRNGQTDGDPPPPPPIVEAAFGNNLNDAQAYHKIGTNLDRIFVIDKQSRIVTFDNNNSNNSNSNNNNNNGEDDQPVLPRGDDGFPPHAWYKDRIGTAFFGYSDENLRSHLGVTDHQR